MYRHCCTVSKHSRHIADVAIIVIGGVNGTQSESNAKVWRNLVSTIQLSTKEILTATHISVQGITLYIIVAHEGIDDGRKHCHLTLEGAKAVTEFTFSSTTHDTEVEAKTPAVLHISNVKGRNHRSL